MKALLLAVLLVFATRSTAQSVKEVQKQIDAKEKQEKQELKMRAKTPLTATFNATPQKIKSELTRICGNKAYIILDSSDNEIRFWAYLVDTGHYPLKNLTPNGQMYGPLIGTAGKEILTFSLSTSGAKTTVIPKAEAGYSSAARNNKDVTKNVNARKLLEDILSELKASTKAESK